MNVPCVPCRQIPSVLRSIHRDKLQGTLVKEDLQCTMTQCIYMSLTIHRPRGFSPVLATYTHNIADPHTELLEGPPVPASINDKSCNLRLVI